LIAVRNFAAIQSSAFYLLLVRHSSTCSILRNGRIRNSNTFQVQTLLTRRCQSGKPRQSPSDSATTPRISNQAAVLLQNLRAAYVLSLGFKIQIRQPRHCGLRWRPNNLCDDKPQPGFDSKILVLRQKIANAALSIKRLYLASQKIERNGATTAVNMPRHFHVLCVDTPVGRLLTLSLRDTFSADEIKISGD